MKYRFFQIPSFRWSPLAVIVPAYYTCKLFGILPMSYSDCENVPYENSVVFIGRRRKNVRDGRFYVTKSGLALWTAQLVLQIWTFVRMGFYLYKTVMQRHVIECSKDNYCSVFGMLLSHTVISPIIVSLVLFRLPRSVDIMNTAARLLHRKRYPRRRLSLNAYSMALFSLVIVIKLVITLMSLPQRYPELYYPYIIAYLLPLGLIMLISILCFIAQLSYEDINRELEELCQVRSKTERAIRLNALMNDHWFLEDYIEAVSDTFGPELIFTIMDIYVQLLLFLYEMVWDTVIRGVFRDNQYPVYLVGSIELSIIIGKFIYLCYRCDIPIKESKRIIFHLKHLSSTVSDDVNFQTILRLFTLRVNSRSAQVTASGFFEINLSLLFATSGVVLIYFLVLVQFQMDAVKQMLSSNSSIEKVVKVVCHSWPCLESY